MNNQSSMTASETWGNFCGLGLSNEENFPFCRDFVTKDEWSGVYSDYFPGFSVFLNVISEPATGEAEDTVDGDNEDET